MTAGTFPRPPRIRDAGPDAMITPVRDWDEVDKQADGSFPASDPPSHSPLRADPKETQK